MNTNNEIHDILEIVTFLKDNAVSKTEFESLRSEVSDLKADVTKIQAEMITKDYLDKKIGELRGDMVVLVKKEDAKVDAVVNELDTHTVLPKESIASIKRHHVFPPPPIISAA